MSNLEMALWLSIAGFSLFFGVVMFVCAVIFFANNIGALIFYIVLNVLFYVTYLVYERYGNNE